MNPTTEHAEHTEAATPAPVSAPRSEPAGTVDSDRELARSLLLSSAAHAAFFACATTLCFFFVLRSWFWSVLANLAACFVSNALWTARRNASMLAAVARRAKRFGWRKAKSLFRGIRRGERPEMPEELAGVPDELDAAFWDATARGARTLFAVPVLVLLAVAGIWLRKRTFADAPFLFGCIHLAWALLGVRLARLGRLHPFCIPIPSDR